MLNEIAPIYRSLIYEYLKIEDLVAIGKTCKTIYKDSSRTKFIVEKISCLFGYKVFEKEQPEEFEETDRSESRSQALRCRPLGRSTEYFYYSLMPSSILEPVKEEFTKRTLSLKFSDIEKLSIEEKKDLTIVFPFDLFFMMDIKNQKKITSILIDHIHEICEHVGKNKLDIYTDREQIGLYPLYEFICRVVCRIFKKGKSPLRLYIMARFITLDCIVGRSSNRSLVDDFLFSLSEGQIYELSLMIEIGLFLMKNFPHFVRDYLGFCLDSYMDMNDMYPNTEYDCIAETVEKNLDEKNKLVPEMSNAQVLEQLLLECKLFSVNKIRDVNKKRHLRYINQNKDR